MLRSAGQEWAGPTHRQGRDSELRLSAGTDPDGVELHTEESRPATEAWMSPFQSTNMLAGQCLHVL